jgi:hypothetical protein
VRTWPALLLAPSLALADQGVAYAMVGWSCASQNQGVGHLVHAAFLLAILATLIPMRHNSRAAFFTQTAFLVGALSAAVVVAMWIPQWVLSPCFA